MYKWKNKTWFTLKLLVGYSEEEDEEIKSMWEMQVGYIIFCLVVDLILFDWFENKIKHYYDPI